MIQQIFAGLPWYKKMEVLRVTKGRSQREAAELCLTNSKNYWVWEKGKSYPRLSSRKAIADAYGLKVEDIFSADDEVVTAS